MLICYIYGNSQNKKFQLTHHLPPKAALTPALKPPYLANKADISTQKAD
ncbi:hypothetical protein NIES23_63770 (plasmid) [Trichormus variabilis NIES-23]|uniref:Uncharacterized protein n=1 Tax=Trichormus variabilis NIES-23 TaxID=1973479 RepID=A0A1Z4KX32_ANAVA|nr:hypothetical protein NIES23_63770 [Trichormus variabilis NIES-23]